MSWTLVPSGADAHSCHAKISLSWVNSLSDEKSRVWEPSRGVEGKDGWSKHQCLHDHWWGQSVIKPFQAVCALLPAA